MQPLSPLIQMQSLSPPVPVLCIAPLLYIQVIYDQPAPLGLEVQCFLLKYFTIIHSFQPVISVMQ